MLLLMMLVGLLNPTRYSTVVLSDSTADNIMHMGIVAVIPHLMGLVASKSPLHARCSNGFDGNVGFQPPVIWRFSLV